MGVTVATIQEQTRKQSEAQRFYDFLKRITLYQSPDHLRKHSEQEWGLPYGEALESSYENIIEDARRAIRGKRRPK